MNNTSFLKATIHSKANICFLFHCLLLTLTLMFHFTFICSPFYFYDENYNSEGKTLVISVEKKEGTLIPVKHFQILSLFFISITT